MPLAGAHRLPLVQRWSDQGLPQRTTSFDSKSTVELHITVPQQASTKRCHSNLTASSQKWDTRTIFLSDGTAFSGQLA